MDFECGSCGQVFDVYEQNEHDIDVYHDGADLSDLAREAYIKCPHCGQRYRTTEHYHWDGKTEVEKI